MTGSLTTSVAGVAATAVNEGTAATFTVTASEAVLVDTEVTLQLVQGTATLADFNAGSFTPAKVIIKAGEKTSTPLSITAITNDGTELSETYSVTATVGGVLVGTANMTIIDGAIGAGQSFVLTKDQDIIPGMNGSNGNAVNSGNDIINGLIDVDSSTGVAGAATTFNGFDQINGGEGTNTLKLATSGAFKAGTDVTVSLANVQKIQVVEINNTVTASAGDAIVVDASTNADVTDLKVTKSTSEIELTGSDAQNISVSGAADAITIEGGKNIVVTDATTDTNIDIGANTGAVGTITVTDSKQGTGTIDIDGGTDVTLTATTDANLAAIIGGYIKVGLGGIVPTGAVKITQNLNATGGDANGDDLAGGAISVKGGKTVEVTVNATSTATKAAADGDITIGTTTVTGDSKTTDVTVTQNATATTFTTPVVAETGATQTVTFKALTAGQTATLGHGGQNLTFTAAIALDAEKVAQAFTDLINSDRQDNGGPTANGTYSGQFAAAWKSASISGAVVTFTANADDTTTLVAGGTVVPTLGTLAAGVNGSGGVTTGNTVTLGSVVVGCV